MKKILFILLISLILLSGCLPDDREFINLIKELDTPEKICQYMTDNFEYENNSITLKPHQLFLIKKGNCDDFSYFATFIANKNKYETYQILIGFPSDKYHMIGVFKEGDYYNISENTLYIQCFCETFREIMSFYLYRDWLSYIVYDYDMSVIEN